MLSFHWLQLQVRGSNLLHYNMVCVCVFFFHLGMHARCDTRGMAKSSFPLFFCFSYSYSCGLQLFSDFVHNYSLPCCCYWIAFCIMMQLKNKSTMIRQKIQVKSSRLMIQISLSFRGHPYKCQTCIDTAYFYHLKNAGFHTNMHPKRRENAPWNYLNLTCYVKLVKLCYFSKAFIWYPN